MAFWQPMASMVTKAPLRSSNSSKAGMAVISLDFASTATCPSGPVLRRGPGAHQVEWSELRRPRAAPGFLPVDWRCLIRKAELTACTQSRKQPGNACGLSRSEDALNVSVRGQSHGAVPESP